MSDTDGIMRELDRARRENREQAAEIERLNALVRLLDNDDAAPLLPEAAAFLDRLAGRIDPRSQSCRHIDKDELEKAADECCAMARKLRGET